MRYLILLFAFISFFPAHGLAHVIRNPIKILILGDSLTQGNGVSRDNSLPAVLQENLYRAGISNAIVINGAANDETAANAPSRLIWYLIDTTPQVLILALGMRDALRRTPIHQIKRNLSITIGIAQQNEIKVFLIGMRLPGQIATDNYAQDFEKIYQELAKQYQIPLLPSFLKGIAGNPNLSLNDLVHPNVRGYELMAERITAFILQMFYPNPTIDLPNYTRKGVLE